MRGAGPELWSRRGCSCDVAAAGAARAAPLPAPPRRARGAAGCVLREVISSSSYTRGLQQQQRARPVGRAVPARPSIHALPPNPWSFGFQCNERYLDWDKSAQIALIKIWLAERMAVTVPEVEARLDELANLLPDLVGKLDRARADVLYELLRDPGATAARLLALRELLPRCNVSALVAGHPRLMLDMSVPEVAAKVAELRARLPGVDVDGLVAAEPMLLRADLPRLMAELARLMPGADHVRLIAQDPQMVLDMDVAGMPSTLELDGSGLEPQ